ncbi:cytochrome c [Pseudidiomarina gelatinasegens]|uniref:Cytochrome c n=1 Tax=Pseudidiomarina gelatinasegens TaxID=2487740 RepID=A0A451GF02_9GAMM|nr:cytochrome c [Pseudidiomarina gelatinasegens]RWU11698.1 cytochrome c [Pseudidiomarina gelatinasegens]
MKLAINLVAVVILAVSANATAQHAFNDADKAVEYRQKALSIMQNNFALMDDMVKGDIAFDNVIFSQRANDFAALASIPWIGFSQEGAMPGNNTDALPAIWDSWDDFVERADQLQKDARALQQAAASGDESAIRGAFLTAAKNCKGCHDQYKD